MDKVILDTNALLLPGLGVDVFTEVERLMHAPFEFAVMQKTKEELENIIKQQKGKDKLAAKIALQLLTRCKVLKTPGHVDDAIIARTNENTTVVTQDKALQQRVKAKGGKIILLRQKSHLVWG